MNIIEVIPIAKGITAESLSYFTSQDVPLGAVVTIPLRKKNVQGIVISTRPAADLKEEIKNATFSLKKLDKIKTTNFFSPAFMEMASQSADYYATSIASILDILVPEYILKNVGKLKKVPATIPSSPPISQSVSFEKYAVQGNDEERYGTWKSLIRQEFARKRSIFFLFPTIEEAEFAFTVLEKGVEGYAFLLNSSLTNKDLIETWNTIMDEPHPVVIISTGGFLSLPRTDIETIVVERESSKAYKIPRRPFLDVRHVTELLAEKRQIKIFFADNFLRMETLWRKIEGEIVEASPFKLRSLSTARDTLIDMRQSKPASFKIISDEVQALLERCKNESENLLILATRRGTAPSTVCGDCQNIVTCNNCSSPVVLHGKSFLCHRCGERRSAEEYCKVCGSWKLGTIGIGIDLVEEKIKDKYPEISLFRIDSDTVANDRLAHNVMQKFREKPGSILLGTEMMLQYIHTKIENSAIISLDSLFSLPDFRIQEKIFSMLVKIRTLTTKEFIVQTRKAEEKVFEYGLKGNISDFYRITIEDRKKFNYPPFSILIKITLEGKKDQIVKEMEVAQTILEPHEVDVFPAFTHTVKGNYVLHGLLRLEEGKWPDPSLSAKLRSLPPSVSIKVDPDTLL